MATLSNDDYLYDGAVTLDELNTISTLPDPYTALTWDNFPILVNSTVDVTGKWKKVEMDYVPIFSVTKTKEFWPECNFEVYRPSLDITTVEGDDVFSHMLTLSSSLGAEYGLYCPGFSASVSFTLND